MITWQQIKFMVDNFGLKEVIFINHDDCRWYQKLSGYHPTIPFFDKGRIDLVDAAKLIMSHFAGVHVRTYWASLDGSTITFAEVK